MKYEIGSMRVLKAAKRWHYSNAKSRSRDFAELGTSARSSIIGKADEALVGGRIPKGGEQKAIVDIEPLRIIAV